MSQTKRIPYSFAYYLARPRSLSTSWRTAFRPRACGSSNAGFSPRQRPGRAIGGTQHAGLVSPLICSLSRRLSSRPGIAMALQRMEHTTDFLSPVAGQANVLVILNFDLPGFTPCMWEQAPLRVCADGGANRLYHELPRLLPGEDPLSVRKKYKPDIIIGDLDSIEPEVRAFYESLNTKVIDKSDDQDTTDLDKCVAFIRDCTPSLGETTVRLIVVGALGGRFDHEVSNINVLYKFVEMRILLLGHSSLLFLLPRGYQHNIHVTAPFEGRHCGIVPIGGPSTSTTTTGLRWNLDASPMAFGALISTSNRPVSERVTVHSDADLLWTIEIGNQENFPKQEIEDKN